MADNVGSLTFACLHCKKAIDIKTEPDHIQIIGGVKLLCNSCKKISVYLGKFGDSPEMTRALKDVENAKAKS